MKGVPTLPFRFARSPLTIDRSKPPVWQDAGLYQPRPELELAIELAINLQRPLLITGEPGCGKTTAAYWAALRLGYVPPSTTEARDAGASASNAPDFFRFQVRSDVNAASAKYEFDAVKYFRDAQLAAIHAKAAGDRPAEPDRMSCIRKGPLWRAFEAQGPIVLLFDEIDKAPRDFPNDLLRELDRYEFEVPEVGTTVSRTHDGPWLCLLTSNQERELPRAFLRRCLHHHIELSKKDYEEILDARRARGELELDDELYKLALARFWMLREFEPALRHKPSLGELLVWFKGLSRLGPGGLASSRQLHETPYLEALLKVPEDVAQIRDFKLKPE